MKKPLSIEPIDKGLIFSAPLFMPPSSYPPAKKAYAAKRINNCAVKIRRNIVNG